MKFQMEAEAVANLAPGRVGSILWNNSAVLCVYPEHLSAAELKGRELCLFAGKISRWRRTQAVARSSLAAFGQVYSERWKDLESMQSEQKEGLFKIDDNIVARAFGGSRIEISVVPKKVRALKLGDAGNVLDREIPSPEGSSVSKRRATGNLPCKQRDPRKC